MKTNNNNNIGKIKHKKLLNTTNKPSGKQVTTSNKILDQLFDT
jgi:hypothetical protein